MGDRGQREVAQNLGDSGGGVDEVDRFAVVAKRAECTVIKCFDQKGEVSVDDMERILAEMLADHPKDPVMRTVVYARMWAMHVVVAHP